jgi:hypothetical protein
VTSTDGFTFADYDAILQAARENRYTFAKFTDPDPAADERLVYLRHDVDNSIEAALHMAGLEARASAVSTYLVLVRSENYNPFSAASRRRERSRVVHPRRR